MKKSENKRLSFIKVPIRFKILNLPNSFEFSKLVLCNNLQLTNVTNYYQHHDLLSLVDIAFATPMEIMSSTSI